MSAYIGPLGQLVEFKCPSDLSVSTDPSSSYRTTMGGRVVEQRGPRGRRTWQASIATATPSQVAALEALNMGVMGPPPWAWVSPDAMSVNALTPNESLVTASVVASNVVASGPIDFQNHFIPSSITLEPNTRSFISERRALGGTDYLGSPVIPGEVITASVYGAGAGGYIELVFRDMSGAYVRVDKLNFGDAISRQWATLLVPAESSNLLIRANSGASAPFQIGGPSITWTDRPQRWAVGRGCSRATVEGLQESLQLAVRGSESMNRSAYSFTVKELG